MSAAMEKIAGCVFCWLATAAAPCWGELRSRGERLEVCEGHRLCSLSIRMSRADNAERYCADDRRQRTEDRNDDPLVVRPPSSVV